MMKILLCSDLDRTLIPNGSAPESPQAIPALSRLVARSQIRLAYVSGRDESLIREAIEEYHLPMPDFAIADVGANLYRGGGNDWQSNKDWEFEIGRDWEGRSHDDITAILSKLNADLELQPPEKQNRYKVSYFTSPSVDTQGLKQSISEILETNHIRANLIWSRDEAEHRGLLDILPRRAGKLEAIRFLMAMEKVENTDTVFAGDSGNDLDVLTSGLQAILVKNAAEDVRKSALDSLSGSDQQGRLYLAKGGFKGMNGNYAAGVLEGLVHFFPQAAEWIDSALSHSD